MDTKMNKSEKAADRKRRATCSMTLRTMDLRDTPALYRAWDDYEVVDFYLFVEKGKTFRQAFCMLTVVQP